MVAFHDLRAIGCPTQRAACRAGKTTGAFDPERDFVNIWACTAGRQATVNADDAHDANSGQP
jgi:hypothetical protein